VTPLPRAEDFERMYDRGAYHDVHYAEVGDTEELRASLEFLGARAAGGRLLDFGAGNGAFLLAAGRRGYTARGVEQGATSIALARQNSGLEVGSLAEVEQSGDRFDIIHLADVLEHLPQPGTILQRLSRLLAPGGVFFLEGPLEKQRSLVYHFASTLKAARRRLHLDRDGDFPPYHLTATDWRCQAHFFEAVMGYTLHERALYETAWPYPAGIDRTAGLARNVRGAVGRAAIAVATTGLGKRLGFGNRFRVIAEPAS
jgi:SAM-dependent methyltransferase